MMKQIALASAVLMGLSTPSFAGDISVEGVWARASAGMARAGAAFMTIKNTGTADKLVSAKADVSKTVELHTHLHEDGIMKMRQVKNIAVNKGMTMLKPGGLHVMFMGLNEPLKEGSIFPLTLVFEKAGEMNVTVMVKKVGAMGMGDAHSHGKMKH
ncbi:copper chaperone PCu(A)C [Terasakiella sp. SH-1]|uniref:copper chaperone PCu(A)C n=1 Tax=Terasakiella sp. SH-1 TaxID=2560057 RepID=UPI001073F399|nr:copper chaperone PCu(A)C [Terasakiella sp. SH-1]